MNKTKQQKARRPGTVRQGQIPIYDSEGRQRGHVSPAATSVAVSRFIGAHGAKLTTVKGRRAWVGPSAPMPRKPENANHAAARGSVRAPK